MPTKVLIADDSEILRVMIRQVLKQDSELDVVGEASTFAQTVELAAAMNPDIILLDLLMPDEKKFTPEAIKLHLLHNAGCILAM